MCHQAVGLVGAELERRGIVTTSISLLVEITEKVRPPRALVVPAPLGFPLLRPNDPDAQTRVIRAALALCERDDVPVLERFGPA
jgi:D-proline reductase (dithiol) PrdB